ncbi:hypothetical protein WJX72_004159 [[Myrmecia] bisecta]|uniref:Uncharacterized protein n=1 Tax=[Myrmecia] bisecta TaxID=41462 RepID=A0AAW1PJQ8_9CHLO
MLCRLEVIAAEVTRQNAIVARDRELYAASREHDVAVDLLSLPQCQDYVQRNLGDLQAVLAELLHMTAERKRRRQEVDQLLAQFGLVFYGIAAADLNRSLAAYINGQDDASVLAKLSEPARLYAEQLAEQHSCTCESQEQLT